MNVRILSLRRRRDLNVSAHVPSRSQALLSNRSFLANERPERQAGHGAGRADGDRLIARRHQGRQRGSFDVEFASQFEAGTQFDWCRIDWALVLQSLLILVGALDAAAKNDGKARESQEDSHVDDLVDALT